MERRHKVIYFDLDGTLVDYESDAIHAFGKAREHAIETYPARAELLTDEIFRNARDATYIQYGDTGIPLRDWYNECMRIALERVELFDLKLAGRMGQLYALFRNTTIRVFDDALDVVPKLARSYRLGLISNGSTKIQKLEIADFFTYSVFAREIGHEKPSPDFFRVAAEVAGCAAGELLCVGDGQHTDILGAKTSGIEMVWINRNGAELMPGIPRPDHEIYVLRELTNIAPI